MTAAEFVPKDINQLTVQNQLPNQLSQLPVNATAETAFVKLTFRHQNSGGHAGAPGPDFPENSYLESNLATAGTGMGGTSDFEFGRSHQNLPRQPQYFYDDLGRPDV